MFSTLNRLPMLVTVTVWSSAIGYPLRYQRIARGKSPDSTLHWTDPESPEFIVSSPKLNGTILGGTFTSSVAVKCTTSAKFEASQV
uniref:Putative secreted protein n=1 Tax=Anopheles darlingi TaxID=43151 RepID=A0A2M4DEK8_ANODA